MTPSLPTWLKSLETRYGLDLRSLALLRIGLAVMVLADLWLRKADLVAHYSDQGVLPRNLLSDLWQPGYWSLYALNGQGWFQGLLFTLAALAALAMLVGYRTRVATIVSWLLLVSLHNRNPLLVFAADDVFRAVMFWAMFLPLGASYSMDRALNPNADSLPKRILTGATLALMAQQCFVYIFSAVFKTLSPDWWPDGTAVYYALSYDQYATPIGSFVLNFPPIMTLFTWITLVLEWLGPLLIWSPIRTNFCRNLAVLVFVGLHLGFGATLNIGIFPFLSAITWLAFIPTSTWEGWAKRAFGPKQQGLKIYYDADCGFCKKMVYLLRNLLVLSPDTPLQPAQNDPEIHDAMTTQNSWVVVDWQGNHHYRFEGIAYIVSLSPVFSRLAPLLRWSPVMAAGTRFYKAVANNRRTAGLFTRPFKFKAFSVKPKLAMSIVTLGLLGLTFLWNLGSITSHHAFVDNPSKPFALLRRVTNSRVLQMADPLGNATRLDQSWSIFAPGPPKDDGWHVVMGKTVTGQEVNVLRPQDPVSFEKPTLRDRNRLYPNMQWRTFFINLNRPRGEKSLTHYSDSLCQQWRGEPLASVEIIFMDERTVPPGQKQTIERKSIWQQACAK
jgi:predicted DCC family thiol-disulfide oxidoreductase YuxK